MLNITDNTRLKIEVSRTTPDSYRFVRWLNQHGYNANQGQTSGAYINGYRINHNFDLSKTYCHLWVRFNNR